MYWNEKIRFEQHDLTFTCLGNEKSPWKYNQVFFIYFAVQVELTICGLFVWYFLNMQLRTIISYVTYPLIYSHPKSFPIPICFMRDLFFGPYLSLITRSACTLLPILTHTKLGRIHLNLLKFWFFGFRKWNLSKFEHFIKFSQIQQLNLRNICWLPCKFDNYIVLKETYFSQIKHFCVYFLFFWGQNLTEYDLFQKI